MHGANWAQRQYGYEVKEGPVSSRAEKVVDDTWIHLFVVWTVRRISVVFWQPALFYGWSIPSIADVFEHVHNELGVGDLFRFWRTPSLPIS